MAERTLEELSRVVAAIHEAGTAPDRWPEALSAVMALVGSYRSALVELSADEFPPGDLHQLEDAIGIALHEAGGRRHVLALRPPEGGAFGDEAKRLMKLIAPHLQLARLVQARLHEATRASLPLQAALDRIATAAFVLDGAARIRHLNAAAAALVASGEALSREGGALSFAEPRAREAFVQALRAAVREPARSSVLLASLGDEALHGVKEVTLRTQLRTIFQKTGTARQSELVRLALTGVSEWGPSLPGEVQGVA